MNSLFYYLRAPPSYIFFERIFLILLTVKCGAILTSDSKSLIFLNPFQIIQILI